MKRKKWYCYYGGLILGAFSFIIASIITQNYLLDFLNNKPKIYVILALLFLIGNFLLYKGGFYVNCIEEEK